MGEPGEMVFKIRQVLKGAKSYTFQFIAQNVPNLTSFKPEYPQ
jgi:hypothetical protein